MVKVIFEYVEDRGWSGWYPVQGVLWGLPQDSCLGPLLFTLYASRLFQEIQHNFPEVVCYTYADDTQLYNPLQQLQLMKTILCQF